MHMEWRLDKCASVRGKRPALAKGQLWEGVYGVADRPKSSAPAVPAYDMVDRPTTISETNARRIF